MRRAGEPRLRHARWPGVRWLRGLWPDHNPLRRTSDRVAAAIVVAAVTAFLVGAPIVTLAAGRWAGAAALQVARHQRATWRQVPAVLLTDAPGSRDIGDGGVALPEVRARWTAPDGGSRRGYVVAPSGNQAGRTVPIWVDQAGRADRSSAPAPAGDRAGRAGHGGSAIYPGRVPALRRRAGHPGGGPAACWPPGTPNGGLPAPAGPASAEGLWCLPAFADESGRQAGTGTPLIATLTTTTGQGACRRQARATGPMPSGAHPALPSTSISAPSA